MQILPQRHVEYVECNFLSKNMWNMWDANFDINLKLCKILYKNNAIINNDEFKFI